MWHQYIEVGSRFRDKQDGTIWECSRAQRVIAPATGALAFINLVKVTADLKSTSITEYSVGLLELEKCFEPIDPVLQKIKLLDYIK